MAWPRKQVLFPKLGLAVILLGLLAAWCRPRMSSINSEKFGEIQFGATKQEVEKILGSPTHAPGEYVADPYKCETIFMELQENKLIEKEGLAWVGEKCVIYLVFDKDGKVTARMGFFDRVDRGPFDQLRSWVTTFIN